MNFKLITAVAALGLLVGAQPAAAATLSFIDIDSTFGGDTAEGTTGTDFAAQLIAQTVDLTANGNVGFKISNNASDGVVEQINFEGTSDLFSSFVAFDPVATTGLDFDVSANGAGTPTNLPEGNLVSFDTDIAFAAAPPPSKEGIGPGQMLTIIFSLGTGKALSDVETALGSGDLRIGVHAIAFADGSSHALVTVPPNSNPPVNEVPLPATLPLLLGALGLIGFVTRRSRAA